MDSAKALNIRLHNAKNELKSIEEQISTLRRRRNELNEEIDSIQQQLTSSKHDFTDSKFVEANFEWSTEAQSLLEKVFQLKTFRSHQLATINATLSGYDVLLVMPTGGGKSLCFQLTALISKGLTVIVSPLISLMEDQLKSLEALGIPTAILSSNTTREESSRILNSVASPGDPPFRLLYVTPEKLAKSKRLLSQLEKCYKNGNFKRLVIDEVHCCSEWGHDFRPDYQFLGIMRNQFPETPILGLTATATPTVINNIQQILNINGCYVLKDSFFRANLHYKVKNVDDLKKEELISKIAKLVTGRFRGQSGLIYCLTIKEVEEVCLKLNSLGIKAMPYHAQLLPDRRSAAYNRWFEGKIQLIVATVAFGMGINKNNVRFVFHFSMSKSFENYYQETGRAGRDGQPAECILFFKFADIFRVTGMVFGDRNGLTNVYSMVAYCLNTELCRKEQIAIYFGDNWNKSCDGYCDNCKCQQKHQVLDVTEEMKTISEIIKHTTSIEKRITALKLIDIWLNKREKKLRPPGLPVPGYSQELAQKIIGFLLINNYLKEEFHFTPYATISYINVGFAWLTKQTSPIKCSLLLNDGDVRKAKLKKQKTQNDTAGDDDDDVVVLD